MQFIKLIQSQIAAGVSDGPELRALFPETPAIVREDN